ncbi:DUF4179 domain-containing protein [Clostridium tagluense]|uniref:DUF4179 domain-containing protein n=2 Tax=Clostridium tagluense TaxID=360422 RepID=UPI001CF434DC|nr:DUF4179 domain-containing protein [Clostridium tagluense]MCB2311326.1 DUF4179 domain-containing protein [Clostridium tagluense]MCB2320902.1 DUF4179 domain-containing protein [Clostridium tagluense]MCB2335482.1 DUF4179 domain-containing protein [Clostridium tagluense]MCB2364291.1 DUF4179 domain-containing protein [Clostridium tagluense]WAG50433.1 DUF4179 domain-containing protein [Clostridium tagluense]
MMNKSIKDTIDKRLANIKISDELEDKILNNSYKTRKIVKKPLAMTAAAVLCIMISVTVMAATIPSFNNLLSLVSQKVEQYLQPIELTSENNGIKMEVVATMSDDDTAVAYLTMQDLTNDRVDKSIDLYHYSITGMNTYTSEVIAYDKATKTATIRLLANGGKKLNGKKVTVKVDSFLSDKQSYNLFDTGIDLAKVISNSTTNTTPLNMNEASSGGGGDLYGKLKEKGTINILKTDEMNIALANINFAHISNIGIIDGRLHVQTKWTGGGIDDHGFFVLINDLGNKIDQNNIYFGADENGNTKYGRNYVEYIFDVNETEINKYKLNADSFTTHGHYTEGTWQTTFKIEAVEKGTEVNCTMDLGGLKINKVSVSPIGISLIGTGNKEANNINVSIKMINGEVMTLSSAISQNEDDEVSYKYMALEPIKVANVKEVSINGNIIKLK